MKKLILAAALIAGTTAAASAADMRMPTKAPMMAAPVATWAGFYIGGTVGGAWENQDGTSNFFQPGATVPRTNNVQNSSLDQSGFIGGLHAGYNWQAGQWVLGAELDWSFTSTGDKSFCRQTDIVSLACTDNGFGFLTITTGTDWLATARARLGFTPWNSLLVYATGGVAWGNVDTTITADCRVNGCGFSLAAALTTGNSSEIATGWVAGVGIEAMLTPNWILRAEYLHADLGSVDTTLAIAGQLGTQTASFSRNVIYDIGRVGLSYKF